MIRYQIHKVELANEARYIARVQLKESYDQDQLVDRMLEVGTSVSRGDVKSVLGLLATTVGRLCSEGYAVNLENFVRFSPAIGGTFDNELDSVRLDRNQIYVNATVSSLFNATFGGNSVERVAASYRSPLLFSVDDLATKSNNQKVTPGNIVTLAGERLKFDPTNPAEYLRFVNAADATQFIAITAFQKLTDKEVVFLMPTTSYPNGYFEMANAMNTRRVRTERSPLVEVAA